MRRLTLGLYRFTAMELALGQSIVGVLGGGNGDLGDIRKSARKPE